MNNKNTLQILDEIRKEESRKREESFPKSEHNTLGNTDFYWLLSVKSLLSASKLLENSIKKLRYNNSKKNPLTKKYPISFFAIDPNFMLKGYSLEDLFKALWLNRGNNLTENGFYKGMNGYRKHDLLEFSNRLNMKFTINEKKLLKALTGYTTAYGRYPISTNFKKEYKKPPKNHMLLFKEIVKKIINEFNQKPEIIGEIKQIKKLIS